MTKLVWRLSKLPTPDELVLLINNKLITQEEAKEILFKSETPEDRDTESLKSEIKFLRDLVEKLSKSPVTIIETIKVVEKPYIGKPWYEPYRFYCGSSGSVSYTTSNPSSYNLTTGSNTSGFDGAALAFNSIKTF